MKIENLMIALLKYELLGSPLDVSAFSELTEEEWKALFFLSKQHDLSHLIGDALTKANLTAPGKVSEEFNRQTLTAFMRYLKLDYGLQDVKRVFEEEKIPFIPLKGAVLRSYYPEPWMRTSCDIDILIRPEDFERAKTVVESKLGGTFFCQTKHDISYWIGDQVHLEMHFVLIERENESRASGILPEAWQYAFPVGDGCEYQFRDEFFYYYHLAHMAKHFHLCGGCGIRSLLDLWFLNQKCDINNREARNALLKRGGLLTFAQTAENISEYWFGDAELTPSAEKMKKIIVPSGICGSRMSTILIQQAKQGKRRYLWGRIWCPICDLERLYPGLKKRHWLTPVYQIRRWFRLLIPSVRKKSVEEWKISTGVAAREEQGLKDMFRELELWE